MILSLSSTYPILSGIRKFCSYLIAGLILLIAAWPVYRLVKKLRGKKKKPGKKR